MMPIIFGIYYPIGPDGLVIQGYADFHAWYISLGMRIILIYAVFEPTFAYARWALMHRFLSVCLSVCPSVCLSLYQKSLDNNSLEKNY